MTASIDTVLIKSTSSNGKVQRANLDTVTKNKAVIAKATGSATILISSTGVDVGTGDVTFMLASTGVAAGTYNSVTVDIYGRILSGTSYAVSYQPVNKILTSISNLSTTSTGFIKIVNGVASLDASSSSGVTSVTLTMPTVFTVTNPTITSSGTIAVSWSGSGSNLVLDDGNVVATSTYLTTITAASTYQQKSTLLTSISGVSKTDSGFLYFNAGTASLETASTQTITLSGAVTGSGSGTIITTFSTVQASSGGTGNTTYVTGDLLVASGSSALITLAAGAVGYVLTSNGSGIIPSWQDISSTYSSITGSANIVTVGTITKGIWNGTVVGTSFGGTGSSLNPTVGALLYAESTSSFGLISPGTSAGILAWDGSKWSVSTSSSGSVKYSNSDTAGYLQHKLAPGTGITFTTEADNTYGTVLSINSIEQSWRLTSYPSANYSVSDDDDTIVVNETAGTANVSIVLPAADNTYDGRIFILQNTRISGTIVLTVSSGLLYNASGAVSSINITNYASIEVQCVKTSSTSYGWIAR
jgi:hypothetical protein